MLGEDQRLRSVAGAAVAVAVTVAVAVAVAVAAGAGCSGAGIEPDDDPRLPAAAASARASGSPAPSPSRAQPVPRPPPGGCYRMSYDEALSPTSDDRPVDCRRPHTARTFAVGRLDDVVAGHLLAVDSERVQARVAATCPARFAAWIGGDLDDRRLSMLRPVWFTPTVAESDRGADWYRCDVIALGGPTRLAPLTVRPREVLGDAAGRNRFGMCGTAAPDTADFQRVICSAPHSWRAVAVVDLPDGRYPGEDTVRARGEAPCQDAGRLAADDPLQFQWGYEWPTAEQWAGGQTFGRCWAPD